MPLVLLLLGGMGVLLLASGGKKRPALGTPTLVGATKTRTQAGSVWRVTTLITPALDAASLGTLREVFYASMRAEGHRVVSFSVDNVLQGSETKTLARMTVEYGADGEINTGSHVTFSSFPGYVLSVTAKKVG